MVDKSKITLDPVSGNFEMSVGNGSIVKFDSDKVDLSFSYTEKDYLDEFEQKQQALHDIIKDGDGLRKDEVYDLVRTANLAAWQESKKNERINNLL